MKKNNKLITASILSAVLAVAAFGMEIQAVQNNKSSFNNENVSSYNGDYKKTRNINNPYFENTFEIVTSEVKGTTAQFKFSLRDGSIIDEENSKIFYEKHGLTFSGKSRKLSELTQISKTDETVSVGTGEDAYDVLMDTYVYELDLLEAQTEYQFTSLMINGEGNSLPTIDNDQIFTTTGDDISSSFKIDTSSITQTSVIFSFVLPDGVTLDPSTSSIKYKIKDETLTTKEILLSDLKEIVNDGTNFSYEVEGLHNETNYEFLAIKINDESHKLINQTFQTSPLFVSGSLTADSTTEDSVTFSFQVGDGITLDKANSNIRYQQTNNPLTAIEVSLDTLSETDNGVDNKYTFTIEGLRNTQNYEFTRMHVNGEKFIFDNVPFTTGQDSVSSSFKILKNKIDQDSAQFQFTLDSDDDLLLSDSSITYLGISNNEVEIPLNDSKSLSLISGDSTTDVYVFELGNLIHGTSYEFTKFKINGYSYDLTGQEFTTKSFYLNETFDVIDGSETGSSIQFKFQLEKGLSPQADDSISFNSTKDGSFIETRKLSDLVSTKDDSTNTYTYTLDGLKSAEEYKFESIKLYGDSHILNDQIFSTNSIYTDGSFKIISDGKSLDSVQFEFALNSGVTLDKANSSVSYTTEGDHEVIKNLDLLVEVTDASPTDSVYTYELNGLCEETNYEFTELEINGNEYALTGQTFVTNTIYVNGSFDIDDSSITGSSVEFNFQLGTEISIEEKDRIYYTRDDKAGQVFSVNFNDSTWMTVVDDGDSDPTTLSYRLDGLNAEVNYEISSLRIHGNNYKLSDQTFLTSTIYDHSSFTNINAGNGPFSLQFSFAMMPGVTLNEANSKIEIRKSTFDSDLLIQEYYLSDLTKVVDDSSTDDIYTYEIDGLLSGTSYDFLTLIINGNEYSLTDKNDKTKQIYQDGTFSMIPGSIDNKTASFEFALEKGVTYYEELSSITMQSTDGTEGPTTIKLSTLDEVTPTSTGMYAYDLVGLSENTEYQITSLTVNAHKFDLPDFTFATKEVYQEGSLKILDNAVDGTNITDHSAKFEFTLGDGIKLDTTSSEMSGIQLHNKTLDTTDTIWFSDSNMTEISHDVDTYKYKISSLDETTNYEITGLRINGNDYEITENNSFTTETVYVVGSLDTTTYAEKATDVSTQFAIQIGTGTKLDKVNSLITYTDGTAPITENLGALTDVSTTEDKDANRFVFEIDELKEHTSYEITSMKLNGRNYTFTSASDDNVMTTRTVYARNTFTVNDDKTTDQLAEFSFETGDGIALDKDNSSITYTVTGGAKDQTLSLKDSANLVETQEGNLHTFALSDLSEDTEYTITGLTVNGYNYDLTDSSETGDHTINTDRIYVQDSFVVGEVTDQDVEFSFQLDTTTLDEENSKITIKDSSESKTLLFNDTSRLTQTNYDETTNTYTYVLNDLDDGVNYEFTKLVINEDRNTYPLTGQTFTTDVAMVEDSFKLHDDETKTYSTIDFEFELGDDYSTKVYDASTSSITYKEEDGTEHVVKLSDLTGGKATDSNIYTYTLNGLTETSNYEVTEIKINEDRYTYALTGKNFTTRTVYIQDSFKIVDGTITDNSFNFSFEMGEGTPLDYSTATVKYEVKDQPATSKTIDLEKANDLTADTQTHTFAVKDLIEDTEYQFTNLSINGYSYDLDVAVATRTVYVKDSFAVHTDTVTDQSIEFEFELGEGTVLDKTTSSITYTPEGGSAIEVSLEGLVDNTESSTDGNVVTLVLNNLNETTNYTVNSININNNVFEITKNNTFTTKTVYVKDSFTITKDDNSPTADSVEFAFTLGDATSKLDAANSSVTYQVKGDSSTSTTVALDSLVDSTPTTQTHTFIISGLDENTEYEFTQLVVNESRNTYALTDQSFITDTVYEKGTFSISNVTDTTVDFSFTLGAETVLDEATSSITYKVKGETDTKKVLLSSLTAGAVVDTTHSYTLTGLSYSTEYEIVELQINDGKYVYSGSDLSDTNTFTTLTVYVEDSFDIIEENTTDTTTQFSFETGAGYVVDPTTVSLTYTYGDGTTGTFDKDSANLSLIDSSSNVYTFEVTGIEEGTQFTFNNLYIGVDTANSNAPHEFVIEQSSETDTIYELDSFSVVAGSETATTVDFKFELGKDAVPSKTASSISYQADGDSAPTTITFDKLGDPTTSTNPTTEGTIYTFTLTGLTETTHYQFTTLNINGRDYDLGDLNTFSTSSIYISNSFDIVDESTTVDSITFKFTLEKDVAAPKAGDKVKFGELGSEAEVDLSTLTAGTPETGSVMGGTTYSYTISGLKANTTYNFTELTIDGNLYSLSGQSTTTDDVYIDNSFNFDGVVDSTTAKFSITVGRGVVIDDESSITIDNLTLGSSNEYLLKDLTSTNSVDSISRGTTYTYTISGLDENTDYEFSGLKVNGEELSSEVSGIWFTTKPADDVSKSFIINEEKLSEGKIQFKLTSEEVIDVNNSAIQYSSSARSTGIISFSDLKLVSHEDNEYSYELSGINPEAEYQLNALTLNGHIHKLENKTIGVDQPEIKDDNNKNILLIALISVLLISTLGAGIIIILYKRNKK